MNKIKEDSQNKTCHQCGHNFFVDPNGVSYHLNNNNINNIDYDKDYDHVAYCNQRDYEEYEGYEH